MNKSEPTNSMSDMWNHSLRVIGYGVVGSNEAKRYMRATMEEFKRLCDDTILLLNNVGPEEKKLIKEYGFKTVEDNREWGKNQQRLKEDFVRDHVSKLRPDWLVCMDMDEVFEERFTRQELEKITSTGWAFHFFVVNLWGDGHKPRRNFWNVRMWKWTGDTEFMDKPLHPGLAPKWAYFVNQYAPFILKHYGLKDKVDRQRKVARYEKYDPTARYASREYYEDLKTDDFTPYDEEKVHKEVADYVQKYKPTIIKKPMTKPKKEFSIIKRTNRTTGEEMQFDVATNEVPRYLSQNTSFVSFQLMGKLEDLTDEIVEMFKDPELVVEPVKEVEFVAEPKPKRTYARKTKTI